ncbi:hypothetical protein LINPERPRIM_LOCUS20141 [Linum perenne]
MRRLPLFLSLIFLSTSSSLFTHFSFFSQLKQEEQRTPSFTSWRRRPPSLFSPWSLPMKPLSPPSKSSDLPSRSRHRHHRLFVGAAIIALRRRRQLLVAALPPQSRPRRAFSVAAAAAPSERQKRLEGVEGEKKRKKGSFCRLEEKKRKA